MSEIKNEAKFLNVSIKAELYNMLEAEIGIQQAKNSHRSVTKTEVVSDLLSEAIEKRNADRAKTGLPKGR